MSWYERFSNKHRNFGLENLMAYVSLSMVIVFVTDFFFRDLNIISYLELYRANLLQGQVWRLVSFAFVPSTSSLFWITISAFFYYFIGRELEIAWGKSTFTLYYIMGMLSAIIASLLTGYANNAYLNTSLVLAYAFLFPNAQFTIYFLIPIKAKYIGYVSLAWYGISIIYGIYDGVAMGAWSTLVATLMALVNFFAFFGPGMFQNAKTKIKNKNRRKEFEKQLRNGRDD